ncbi:MAG: response regulator transcription factor [Myxococcota bacterium]
MTRRVVLIDDHDVVRQGLKALIEDAQPYTVVGEGISAADGLRVVEETQPDLVVVDLILGEGPDGIQLTKGIKAAHPMLPVLMLSGRDESLFAERALLAGASGYVMKDLAVDILLDAMAAVLEGDLWLSESMWSRLLPEGLGGPADKGPDPLEAAVTAELRRGNRTVAGVAQVLERRPSEIEWALAQACERLRLPSRTALMLYVQRAPADQL